MNNENTTQFPLAIIADIHGNRWALEAVLQDIDARGIQHIVNLGDSLTGPLDPVSTANLLIERNILSINGNDDREIFSPADQRTQSQTYTRELLTPAHLDWLRQLPDTVIFAQEVFLCHGDLFDAPYLLEQVSAAGVFLRATADIVASVAAIPQQVILSGHSHQPRTIYLPQGKLLINPGSVGLPAYTMDTPVAYAMEAGSPHARYAILTKTQRSWQIEHAQIPYDWQQAASVARDNQRPDWATWIATGRAS